ncbi:MAG TPA: GerMN domain-containing protein [Geobacteraceae bacterium]
MKRSRRQRRGVGILVVAFIVCAVVLGALLLQKYERRQLQPAVPPTEQTAGVVAVTLYFAATDGSGLVREGREIEVCETPTDCMAAAIDELVNGPVGDLAPVLPPNGTIHAVQLAGDLATVDLSRELVEALPSGSNSEELAAYAIIHTLTHNFPQVKRVAFTMEGRPLTTLKGHLDLRQPLSPELSLVRGETPATQGVKP